MTALYQAHALSLARLALVMLGDAAAAEDVVQDAFLGLFRRWDSLSDAGAAAPGYLRTSVLNGCRTAIKRRSRPGVPASRPTESAESAEAMQVSRGAIKSATSRAVSAVGRMLREDS